MPQGQPAKKEAKKPKKDAPARAVRAAGGESASAVEIVAKRRKERSS